MQLLAFLQILACCVLLVLGNVEKTIFLGPELIRVPQQHPNLQDLFLDTLSPSTSTLRLKLPAAFSKPNAERGEASWFLLDGLRQHQRYEVRLCWAATQPTSFNFDLFTLNEVFNTPSIITSLAVYSESRQDYPSVINTPRPASAGADPVSILFLRVEASADYFTTNKTLMQNVPPVNVDIILDPYVFGVFPRSLAPTAAYLVIIAVLAWYLSGYIWQRLHQIAQESSGKDAPFNTSTASGRKTKVI
ncbi:hypothetical protein JMJ35_009438 [Cladonia borealis]|uniref:Uncharacterized protein n=1 Tax=Cladonia borealis TaxID=184061 RepID=A0AA39QUW5_9LECA|nr:hypothetical protein JMJ35_009438 [Cladonia borealis]